MRTENPDFLEFCYRRIWRAAGASENHADAMARAISLGDRMGKQNQGLGVFEIPLLLHRTGTLDIEATPEIVDEGPTWLVVDGHRSSGQWTLTIAMERAIEKARESAVAIALARNHNDAGSFFAYTSLAIEQDMLAIATNNSLRLAAPWGGMENMLSGAPFSAASPGGEEFPLVCDIQAIEAHDGDISEAHRQGRRLKGKFLVDPETGELTDDPAPYFRPIEGCGRVSESRAASVFGSPRLYALNLFTEMLCGLLVPGGRITPDIPYPVSAWEQHQDETSVGGSFLLVIDPSHFMPVKEFKDKSDRLVRAVKSVKRLPGVEEILLPGERGFLARAQDRAVPVLEHQWQAFVACAEEHGLDLEQLRQGFATLPSEQT